MGTGDQDRAHVHPAVQRVHQLPTDAFFGAYQKMPDREEHTDGGDQGCEDGIRCISDSG